MLIFRTSNEQLSHFVGLDNYMFLQYLKTGMWLFFVFALFGLTVLMPLNYNGGNQQSNLDRFTITNIHNQSSQMWVHFAFAWAFTMLTFYSLYGLYKEVLVLVISY
jgi:hypothetical protein